MSFAFNQYAFGWEFPKVMDKDHVFEMHFWPTGRYISSQHVLNLYLIPCLWGIRSNGVVFGHNERLQGKFKAPSSP